jgi:hypothetical protein
MIDRALRGMTVRSCTSFGLGQTAFMPFGRSSQTPSSRSPREIWADWMDANEAGDVARAGSCAVALTEAAALGPPMAAPA